MDKFIFLKTIADIFTRPQLKKKVFIRHIFLKSYTLIEVLISLGIFFVMVSLTFMVMKSGSYSWFTGDVSVELRNEIIKAFTIMEKELKETTTGTTASCTISLDSESTSNSVSFPLPGRGFDGTVILDSAGQIQWGECITYELNTSGEIVRRSTSGADSPIAQHIGSLQFTRPSGSANIIQVDITAQKGDAGGKVISDSGQIMIKMRN